MAQTSIIAGAHLKCYVNGRILGWASGVKINTRTPVKAIFGIDDSLAVELAPTTYAVQGTLQIWRGRNQGGAEGLGLVSFAEKLLLQKYFTLELVDRVTDGVVFKAIGCLTTSQDWTISPKGLISGSISFEGMNTSNESD